MVGRKLRRNEGFSLIEVLVALVILAVGLLGLALFQTTAIKGNAIAVQMDRRHGTGARSARTVPPRRVGQHRILERQRIHRGTAGAADIRKSSRGSGRQHDRPRDAVLQGLVCQSQCDKFAQDHHRLVLLERRRGAMAQHHARDPTVKHRGDLR